MTTKEKAKQVKTAKRKPKEDKPDFEYVMPTGSTLLDLAISGFRVSGGGVPGGTYIEIFGPSSWGKTALLMEMFGYLKSRGGCGYYVDCEGRLDRGYSSKLGIDVPEEEYAILKKVEELQPTFQKWVDGIDTEDVNMYGFFVDGVASLSSVREMDDKDGDKRGQSRAKALHKFFRVNKSEYGGKRWVFVFTNQAREGDKGVGYTSPGGKGLHFMSSCRILVGPNPKGRYITQKKKIELGGKKVSEERRIGIRIVCTIKKSSIDWGYRSAPVTIRYGYGIDDIAENLQYIKDNLGHTKYICPDGEGFRSQEKACIHVEENKLEADLKQEVITVWNKIEGAFKESNRKKKKRN